MTDGTNNRLSSPHLNEAEYVKSKGLGGVYVSDGGKLSVSPEIELAFTTQTGYEPTRENRTMTDAERLENLEIINWHRRAGAEVLKHIIRVPTVEIFPERQPETGKELTPA